MYEPLKLKKNHKVVFDGVLQLNINFNDNKHKKIKIIQKKKGAKVINFNFYNKKLKHTGIVHIPCYIKIK